MSFKIEVKQEKVNCNHYIVKTAIYFLYEVDAKDTHEAEQIAQEMTQDEIPTISEFNVRIVSTKKVKNTKKYAISTFPIV